MKAYLEIEMPKNCNGCPLHFYEGQGICSCCVLPTIEDDEILKPWKNKRKDCPLVPIQPHGRLIDEKDICDKIRPLIENPYCYNRLQVISETLGNCLQIVRDAPTIIPAEEGET